MDKNFARTCVATCRHWVTFIGVRRLIASVGGLAVALGVGWFVVRPSETPLEFVLPSITIIGDTPDSSSAGTNIHVHVVGAVKNPGVYILTTSSRVVDAVAAAGGSLSTADLEGINMAQTLLDAEQVFIPTRRSQRTTPKVAPRLLPKPRTTTTVAGTQAPVSNVVNINTATATQLESLTGVGPATAKAIIAYRTSKGAFTKVEDLLNVPGIGPSKLAAMRNEVSVS